MVDASAVSDEDLNGVERKVQVPLKKLCHVYSRTIFGYVE